MTDHSYRAAPAVRRFLRSIFQCARTRQSCTCTQNVDAWPLLIIRHFPATTAACFLQMFKKQEKRQGKELLDIVNNRSNLNRCGECGAEHPTWASYSLGIFLCGRCANIHKNVLSVTGPNGKPISRVKSLTLDKWSDAEIDNLRHIGNRKARNKWNPKRVPFPHDDDDDGPIEEYFREKYILGLYRNDALDAHDYDYDDDRSGFSRTSSPDTARNGRSRSSTVNSYRLRASSMQLTPRNLPRLSHRKLTSYERSLYSIQAVQLHNMGYSDRDSVLESLILANGDMDYALDILAHDAKVNPAQAEIPPDLPRRPTLSSAGASFTGSANGSAAATGIPRAQSVGPSSSDWWASSQPGSQLGTQQTQQTLLQTLQLGQPQIYQYTDPVTGQISYVDSNGNQYLDPNNPQHQQLLMQQTNPQFAAQNNAKQNILSMYNQPTGAQQAQPQPQPQFQQQQQTGFAQMNQTGMQPAQTGQFGQPQFGMPQQTSSFMQPQQSSFMMTQPQFQQGQPQFFG